MWGQTWESNSGPPAQKAGHEPTALILPFHRHLRQHRKLQCLPFMKANRILFPQTDNSPYWIKRHNLLYRYWWNTRIFPFTKKTYLHRAQWRYYFYLSRVRILVWPWLLTRFFSSLLEFWLFGTENMSIIVFFSPL